MKYTLKLYSATATSPSCLRNKPQKTPKTIDAGGRSSKTFAQDETRYIIQVNWFAFKVRVYDHENKHIATWSHKHNRHALTNNFICFSRLFSSVDRWKNQTVQFSLNLSEITRATIKCKKEWADEPNTKWYAQIQLSDMAKASKSIGQVNRLAVPFELPCDTDITLGICGQLMEHPYNLEYSDHGANNLVTNDTHFKHVELEPLTCDLAALSDFISDNNVKTYYSTIQRCTNGKRKGKAMQDKPNRDPRFNPFAKKGSAAIDYAVEPFFTESQMKLLPDIQKASIATELIEDSGDMSCTELRNLVSTALGDFGIGVLEKTPRKPQKLGHGHTEAPAQNLPPATSMIPNPKISQAYLLAAAPKPPTALVASPESIPSSSCSYELDLDNLPSEKNDDCDILAPLPKRMHLDQLRGYYGD